MALRAIMRGRSWLMLDEPLAFNHDAALRFKGAKQRSEQSSLHESRKAAVTSVLTLAHPGLLGPVRLDVSGHGWHEFMQGRKKSAPIKGAE
jgi:hypothetical protein